jgi:hypothetical protein
MVERSKGHVAFWRGIEFIRGPDGSLYIALAKNSLGADGYRKGAWPERGPQKDNHEEYLRETYGIKEKMQ